MVSARIPFNSTPQPAPAGDSAARATDPEWFYDDYARFTELSAKSSRPMRLNWEDRKPCVDDRTADQSFDRHYIYHTAWAARVLASTKPDRHIDISSSLYFCSIASAFVPVEYYEFRQTPLQLDGLKTGTADLMHLPFETCSIQSLSCMHVVEHIGLGRYGDPIDPEGDLKAMSELARVLAPGGSLLFVVPVGKPRVEFNAHRIYSPEQIRDCFGGFNLQQFALIPDGRHQMGLVIDPSSEFANSQNYACGCFWFRRAVA